MNATLSIHMGILVNFHKAGKTQSLLDFRVSAGCFLNTALGIKLALTFLSLPLSPYMQFWLLYGLPMLI